MNLKLVHRILPGVDRVLIVVHAEGLISKLIERFDYFSDSGVVELHLY